MNYFLAIGRLTADPEVRATETTKIARYRLAIDRRFKKEGEQTADFVSCVVFGKGAEFAEKYLHKGMKIAIAGRVQTGSYQNKDGQTVYTTDVIVESQEFCESKKEPVEINASATDDFMSIPDDMDDELPFV